MNDNYTKFEFIIQLLYTCHKSNDDSTYIISVYKIYSKNNSENTINKNKSSNNIYQF